MTTNHGQSSQFSRFIPILVAVVSLLGVVIGAGVSHFLSRESDKMMLLENQQKQTFLNYIRANTERYAASKLDDKQKLLYADAHLNAARQEIAAYGPSHVVQALIEYQNSFIPCNDPNDSDKAVPFFQSIRNTHNPNDQRLEDSQMAALLRLCK